MIGPVVFVVMLAALAVLASRCPEVNDDDLVVGPVDVAEWRWWEDAVVTLHRVVVVTQAVVETLTRFDGGQQVGRARACIPRTEGGPVVLRQATRGSLTSRTPKLYGSTGLDPVSVEPTLPTSDPAPSSPVAIELRSTSDPRTRWTTR